MVIECSWQPQPSYTPTVLISCFAGHPLSTVANSLAAEGPDVRIVLEPGLVQPRLSAEWAKSAASAGRSSRRRPHPANSNGGETSLFAAARAVQPDVLVMAGSQDDEWAFDSVRELRSDPITHDVGLVLFPCVSLPEEMEITPMTGPDAWVYQDARPAQALETIRRTVQKALEGRLDWAQRDWSASDRRRHAIKSHQLYLEEGRSVEPHALANRLYGGGSAVDIRVWDRISPHLPGWRFGGEERYGRPLSIRHEVIAVDTSGLGEHRYTLHSRSGQLLLAASHAIAELSGGWPTLEPGSARREV